ncbi:uracil-DNA glycosylase [Taibaiella sp. KBW10]|uniref:uracil-DNA glycosylase n=1 Tax=Taibaiella sp. KBW10 TaxID=2153357 RepID=UPI000F5B3EEB|nr:uracil-DNA glycosylase [Taibaiella sp. KBW10]RQO30182.1 uracil-DNA glycosylase [Taibaiella sp. KBW10]
MEVQIEQSWKQVLKEEFEKPYFKQVVERVKHDRQQGITLFPSGADIFRAFELCPFDQVKIVLLGQDPYHGFGQAHGLCFSVLKGVKSPPSLQNIYKELQTDIPGFVIPDHGFLESWAKQGVLMLNTSLTVQAGLANSHGKIGWETFTNAVIQKVSEEKEHVVFILWGRNAQSKKSLIDGTKHLILESAHPSPLSAYNGFFGSRPFSKTNTYLAEHHLAPIEWQV